MRETTSGRENTMFVYLPAKGCENNCAFCSKKHIKADKYTPSQEKSIDLSNSIRVFLKENRDVDTLKIFNGGNVLHGSEYGKSMEVHEYFWDKLVELIGDLQEMSGGSLNLSSIELEVRLDELVETDDPRKMVIQERVINLKDRLSELGIELRLILAYEYIDNKVIRSQGKFANIDNQEDRIREALGFLHSHNIPSLAYAMFGGRAGDRPMRSDEAIDAAVNTIKFGLSIENGPREVIVNCQYLDPLQQEDEKGKGKQLYVPQQEDFVTLVLRVSDLLKEADGSRVRISHAA
jgi:hypothetical protein